MQTKEAKPTLADELVNSITHGIGTAISIAGLVVLVVFAAIYGTVWHIVSFSIFGATSILLYLSSTLYHAFYGEKVKRLFRKFDHMGIYLLIAGTYTPFCLTILRGPLGWTLFGIIWGMAIVGIVKEIFLNGKWKIISTIAYLIMGWVIVIAIYPMYMKMTFLGFVFLVAGGIAYSLGTYFFVNEKVKFNHGIWHLFVLAGTVCHFFAVLSLL